MLGCASPDLVPTRTPTPSRVPVSQPSPMSPGANPTLAHTLTPAPTRTPQPSTAAPFAEPTGEPPTIPATKASIEPTAAPFAEPTGEPPAIPATKAPIEPTGEPPTIPATKASIEPTAAVGPQSDEPLRTLITQLASIIEEGRIGFETQARAKIDEFIAASNSHDFRGDAQFLRTCFAVSPQAAAPSAGWGLLSPTNASPQRLASLNETNAPLIDALEQFPESLRGSRPAAALVAHPDFLRLARDCHLFTQLIDGPYERYILWRSWEPGKRRFVDTIVAAEILKTTYGDIVDYTLGMVLYEDMDRKIRLLEGIIANGPTSRLARTAFKQLYNAYTCGGCPQRPERTVDIANRWLAALTAVDAPEREFLEALHRLERLSDDPMLQAQVRSAILSVTDLDYLAELETDLDFLGGGGFRFGPSARTIPKGMVTVGVDSSTVSEDGFQFVVEAIQQWEVALQADLTFKVSYVNLPQREEGDSLCVEAAGLGAFTWSLYSYNPETYGRFSRNALVPSPEGELTFELLPAGLALTPLSGRCRSIGVREDVIAGNEDLLRYVLLHEIGHVLGLPHSPHPDDVLSVNHSTNNSLSARDIRSVRKLYSGQK